jgi:hypothetical protein
MKTYNILEAGDVIQKGDEMKSSSSHPWNTRLTERYIGEIYDEGFAPMRRPIPQPQWQTGKIPEPTGLCIVVMETNVNNGSAIIIQAIPNDKWEWLGFGYSKMSPNQLRVHADYTTGRWYMQAITLPS